MGMEWKEATYHAFGLDLGLEGSNKTNGRDYQDLTTSDRVKEEVLETFLMFNLDFLVPHLGNITEAPLQFVNRSHTDQFSGGEDLVAWDELGRVHLFELKKQTINEQAVDQLVQYAVEHLFQPPREFIEREWHDGNEIWSTNRWWTKPILAGYLAGAYLNEQVTKLGYETVTGHLDGEWYEDEISYQGWPPSKNWWTRNRATSNASARTKKGLRFAAASSWAERDMAGQGIDALDFSDLASRWRAEHPRTNRPIRPKFSPEYPLVMWFVAPNIADSESRAITKWRSRGLDARAVQLDVRRDEDTVLERDDKEMLRVERQTETAPVRDDIERQLFEHLEDRASGSLGRLPRLELNFYERETASGQSTKGQLLEQPKVRFEKIDEPNWMEIDSPT